MVLMDLIMSSFAAKVVATSQATISGGCYTPGLLRDASPLAPAPSPRRLPALRRGGEQERGVVHGSRHGRTAADDSAAVPELRRGFPPGADASRLRNGRGRNARLLRRAGGRHRPHRGAAPAPARHDSALPGD